MNSPIAFLMALGQAFASMSLYAPGHPSRTQAIQAAWNALESLLAERPLKLSFIGGEVVWEGRVLRELKEWEWATRFAALGVERLEFIPPLRQSDLESLIDLLHSRLRPTGSSPNQSSTLIDPSFPDTGIRYGRLSLSGDSIAELAGRVIATSVRYDLSAEVAGVKYVYQEAGSANEVAAVEAETIVRSLALAMRQQGDFMLPLLQIRDLGEYQAVHSLNLAVLAMGLAEYLGLAPRETRAIGVAAILADLGNVKLPQEILIQSGALSDDAVELVRRHCAEGARMILSRHPRMEFAAVVAYEHHLNFDGSGYPALTFPRTPHFVSRLVRICDVYDAALSIRPWRESLRHDEAMRLLTDGVGTSFDPDLVASFSMMLRSAKVQRLLPEDRTVEIEAVREVA